MWTDSQRAAAAATGFALLGLVLHLAVPDSRITWDAARVGVLDDVVPLAFMCLGETQRHRRPVIGLALGVAGLVSAPLVGGSLTIAAVFAHADLLFCAVRSAGRRASLTITGIVAAIIVVPTLVTLVTGGPAAAIRRLMELSSLAIPVAWAREVRHHRERAADERARADQTHRMADLDRARAIAAERARMARDLHDVVAGQLSGIAIQSEAALSLPDTPPQTLRRVLGDVRRDSVAALDEMRAMIGLLRDGTADPPTAPAGLAALDGLLATARSRGLTVEVADRRAAGAQLPAAVDLTAYRIVAEALTNAAKHAPGSVVRLVLSGRDVLVVEVDNDLTDGPDGADGRSGSRPGRDPVGTGTGLLGLGERAAAVGGRVEAGRVGATWSVRAELPAGSGP